MMSVQCSLRSAETRSYKLPAQDAFTPVTCSKDKLLEFGNFQLIYLCDQKQEINDKQQEIDQH